MLSMHMVVHTANVKSAFCITGAESAKLPVHLPTKFNCSI